MRAYHVTRFDTPPALCERPRPTPANGEIGLRITACGLNFADLLMIEGRYQDTPALPFSPGLEVAGVVEEIGPGTDGPAPGTRVVAYVGHGGLAEYACVPAARVVALPPAMPDTEAAALQITYGTGHVALDYKARLQPGETLLVLGAAGGVGLAAVEIGKALGAQVIACARGADKLAIAKAAGADHLIDASRQDIREACKALGGVDVVYDPVGGDQFTAAFRACRPEARILTIGFASGDVPQIRANHMLVKNISVIGFYWGGYLAFKPQILTDSLATLMRWHGEGRIKPHISHTLPLDQVAQGLDLLRSRTSTGKVVITIG